MVDSLHEPFWYDPEWALKGEGTMSPGDILQFDHDLI